MIKALLNYQPKCQKSFDITEVCVKEVSPFCRYKKDHLGKHTRLKGQSLSLSAIAQSGSLEEKAKVVDQ